MPYPTWNTQFFIDKEKPWRQGYKTFVHPYFVKSYTVLLMLFNLYPAQQECVRFLRITPLKITLTPSARYESVVVFKRGRKSFCFREF